MTTAVSSRENPAPQRDEFVGSRKRHSGALAAAIVVILSALLLALPLWNLAVLKWQQTHVVFPGNLYMVEGRSMRIYCTGTGSPVVILETGLGSSPDGWQIVQPKLSRLTTVCSYGRSGLGWSEPRSGPRDAEAIARQLHTLLNEAEVPRPVVFAAHSAGGLYVREYAREFPTDVAGVALVDSASPQQIDELPGSRSEFEAEKRDEQRRLWLDKLQLWSGYPRLIGKCHFQPPKGLENIAALMNAEECRPERVEANLRELLDVESASQQAGRLTTFGDKPLLVISEDPKRNNPEQAQAWEREQEQLKSLSPKSWRVIAEGSGHAVMLARPDLVVAEITKLVGYLRGDAVPPFGSTTAE